MKKARIIIITLLSVLIIALPFVSVVTLAVTLPAQFDNSFVGALPKKCERLYSIDEPKIVIVGGSSVAFGFDSELIEKYTGMPVVNFGMYAALGTKIMLDLSRDAIKEGDVVIIAPELDEQTLSLYFSSETTLRAFDGNFELIKHVEEENLFSLLSATWKFTIDKIKYLNSEKPNPSGVYNAANFNEYGDVDYARDENVMSMYYDPTKSIELSNSIIDADFAEYLNDYIAHCKNVGATVAYAFCPMNEMAISKSYDELSRYEFAEYLSDILDCEVLGDIEKYIYESGYFYDSNFHLNDAGARLHTINILWEILALIGDPTFVDEEIPEAPPLPDLDVKFDGEDENAKYFIYEEFENGTYKIVGLSELGKTQTTLTLPLGYNGYKVTSVGARAFYESGIEKLIVPVNTNLTVFESGAFLGASGMKELWIYYPIEADILPPADFVGVSNDFTVHIPETSDYEIGYFWSERGLTFVKDAN